MSTGATAGERPEADCLSERDLWIQHLDVASSTPTIRVMEEMTITLISVVASICG
jgi:hypothetical protein